MAERQKLSRDQMGPIRKMLDSGGKWNTRFDAVMVPTLYVAFGVGAAALAAVNLMAGIHIREEYVKKGRVKPTEMKQNKEYKIAA